MKWTETRTCQNHGFCARCKSPGPDGVAFRAGLVRAGLLPDTSAFPCPHRVGLGDLVAKVTTAAGIKPCGGCKRRQAVLNRLVPDIRHPLQRPSQTAPAAPGAIGSP